MPESHCVAYAGVRARVCDVLEAAGPDVGSRPTPATPEWTVHDVLAHLVGVADDVLNGRLDGAATDPWTANQVDLRRKMTVAELARGVGRPGPGLRRARHRRARRVLRPGTLRRRDPRARHPQRARRPRRARQRRRRDRVGLVHRRAHAPAARPRSASSPSPATRLPARASRSRPSRRAASRCVRAVTGRRTASEIARYGWQPAPQPELLLAAPLFRLRTESLGE